MHKFIASFGTGEVAQPVSEQYVNLNNKSRGFAQAPRVHEAKRQVVLVTVGDEGRDEKDRFKGKRKGNVIGK